MWGLFILIGAGVLYWVIRSAVFSGMSHALKDFELWKRELDEERDEQVLASCPLHARFIFRGLRAVPARWRHGTCAWDWWILHPSC
jgi:hypothetical protein